MPETKINGIQLCGEENQKKYLHEQKPKSAKCVETKYIFKPIVYMSVELYTIKYIIFPLQK